MNVTKIHIGLLLYKFFFTIIAYNYFLEKGGDASIYWFQSDFTNGKSWFDFIGIGTNVILFINYPFAKILNLPIVFGFFFHSFIGFLAILQFFKLIKLWLGSSFYIFKINIIPLLLFLPNLNFWTSILGKEPLVFLSIVTILLQFYKKKYFTFTSIASLIVLLLLRPHFFLMLLFSIGCISFIYEKRKLNTKILFLTIFTILLSISFFMFLKISKIRYINWERIKRFNDYSLHSVQDSKSYIPMIEYNYFEKLFAFYFRPMFFDAHNSYGIIISVENLFMLMLCSIAMFLFIKYYKNIQIGIIGKSILLYAIIAGFLFVQRYSDLGLIQRTKSLIQPFVLLLIIKVFMNVKEILYEKRKTF